MNPELSQIIVSPDLMIVDALRVLDETGGKILFIVDGGVLAGVLTDGDIRRHILAGRTLTDAISIAMNRSPLVIAAGCTEERVREQLLTHRVHCMPVVDGSGAVVDAVWWGEVFADPAGQPRTPANVPVAIMAGGMGTRLDPFTRILPKPLIPVGDNPVLRLIMDRMYDQGCARFLVSLNFKASLIRAYFSDEVLPYGIEFFDEDQPLGTAGSLSLMSDSLGETFILTNCDNIMDIEFADLVKQHRESGNLITVVASMKHVVLPYGIIDVGPGGALEALHEKPRYDLLASTGMYVMEPDVLDLIVSGERTDATDLIARAMEAGSRVGVYPIPERLWLDVGQLEELQFALDRLGIR
ncbi:MAG: CBS domain-containing protein [Actinobacteria bacterium]|nr:CBS domain-containing protein [Actinomycetota bacterium]